MAPSRTTPFQSKHALEYGLELVATSADGDQTVRCKFCVYEGRDKVEVCPGATRKRKSRTDIQFFKRPFKPENYRSHLKQHEASWAVYKELSLEKKKVYFTDKISSANTMHSFVDSSADTIVYTIKGTIVDDIIGDLFFRPDQGDVDEDDDELGDNAASAARKKAAQLVKQKVNAMSLFKLAEDEEGGLEPSFSAALDKHDLTTTFDEAWDVTAGRWVTLQTFCCGLAAVFPNTTSVESDFSILKWEMDENRTDMMHLSLEGVFQAKQRDVLQALSH
ncbi:hypothetical protein SPRG_09742 [Saprolegnia parasitica CBS 223.65]|uniref:Uncharacterized protein n=1 Tax=Saprolegnia parasitica (strain CBS 223.65) TaxID=695850 RepID=A0A067CDW0_SAPPC|nr:hypothetical protein SPRG_09742 [Saprolegnia parasitica CBS 223.65]KDO25012.1 hypothetical protein SPRG_09742 [Saprolegnia parasitica CBS 223.65]|eukprot:XP_012204281.1 hypothetical protein SPRG_09742 [Saprolegnia parasitica CBS 223.65]